MNTMKRHVLDIFFDNNGQKQAIHPVLLQHESELVMVDCGYPGIMPLLEDAAMRHRLFGKTSPAFF